MIRDARHRRNVEIHQAKAENPSLSQQAIAERSGMSRQRVAQVLQEKPVMTEKTSKPPRQVTVYQINSGTRPATAAAKIIDKFGKGPAVDGENLKRNELSPAERSMHMAERKRLYEEMHPETKNGENQHTRKSLRKVCEPKEPLPERFTADTAKKTGVSELSPAERSMHLTERKRLYEEMHPETKNGGGAKGVRGKPDRKVCELDQPERFTADTAKKTGVSERKVQMDVARGEKIQSIAKAEARHRRNVEIHQARAENPSLSQQAIAERFGMKRETVRNVLAEKPVMTEKTAKPPRQITVYQINSGTQPSTAPKPAIAATSRSTRPKRTTRPSLSRPSRRGLE